MRQAGQLITPIQEQAVCFKTIVAIVLVTFITLNLQPLAAAAQTAPMTPAPPVPRGLSEKLQALKESVQAHAGITESVGGTFDLEANLDNAMAGGRLIVQEELEEIVDEILDQARDIETEHEKAMAEFEEVGQWIEDEELGPVIRQRHTDAVAEYQDRYSTFQQRIDDLSTAPNGQARQRALQGLNNFLQDQQFQRRHQPFDPDNLPFRVPDGKVREPATTKEQFQALGLIQSEPIQVAAAELDPLMLAQGEDLPKPEHLEPTVDAQITQGIRDKAQELNHHPVEIYNWVRNTIEFLPTHGSIQGSDMTLLTERGNAFDTASLLIALLRASDIPARYVYGTVEIPIEQVMNWVGGVETPEAALQLLGQGGIPSTGLTSGGDFVAVRMEHVWVEAWVDFIPSRGAVNKQGDTWVPLDGSFKQFEYEKGVDGLAIEGVDLEEQLQTILNNAEINTPERWIRGIDVADLQNIVVNGQTQLRDILVQDEIILTEKRIIQIENPVLSTGLPYVLETQGATYSVLPDSVRKELWLSLYASEQARVLDNTAMTYHAHLPSLAGKTLSVSYEPASDADRQTLASFVPGAGPDGMIDIAALPQQLPGYLISVNARLMVGEQTVATAGPFTLGQDLSATLAISRLTGGRISANNVPVAGETFTITLDLQGYSNQQLRKSPQRTAIQVLQQAGEAYFANLDSHLNMLRMANMAMAYRQPSFGVFSTRINTELSFGVPREITLNGTRVDVDGIAQSVAVDDPAITAAQVGEQIGLLASDLEHEIPSAYWANADFPAESVSSIRAITEAMIVGQRIYSIDARNLATALSVVNADEAAITDIRQAVNAGLEVIVSQNPVAVGQWRGTGYIIRDPVTGSGAYRVAGGANGGESNDGFGKALSYVGLGALANFVVPPAHADTPAECGADEDIQINWADELLWALLLVLLLILLTRLLVPALVAVVPILVAWLVTINPAAAAQESCAIYIVGEVTSRGGAMEQVQAHVGSALGTGSPNFLTYMGPGNRHTGEWLRERRAPPECDSEAKQAFRQTTGEEPSCDEYPFASTFEGGEANYRAPNNYVSLRLVPLIQNRRQGGANNRFFLKCGVREAERFEVRVDSGVTRGVGRDGAPC